MIRLLGLFLLALSPLTAQSVAGKYAGKWTGLSAGGGFNMSFTSAGGEWKADITFTLADTEVKTKVTMLKVDGAQVEVQYEFDLGGNLLQSTISGELKGDRIAGKYTTVALPSKQPVDQGEFDATRGK